MQRRRPRGAAVLIALALGLAATSASAQFEMKPAAPPQPGASPAQPAAAQPAAPAGPSRLTYQYGYGSESEARYRRNADLDSRLRDNLLTVKPQVNGIVVYRPTNGVELTLEMIAEKELAVKEEAFTTLPSGETQRPPARHASVLVDQAFIAVRPGLGLEFAAGRKNYEDERHWLFDTSMDIVSAGWRNGPFRVEAWMGREVRVDLDFGSHSREPKDRNDTAIVYADYRGIEDLRLGAYVLARHDRRLQDGHPRLLGLRAVGVPSDSVNYWADLALLRGRDETGTRFRGRGYDLGYTYRFLSIPFHPAVTLGYAAGTGDANPNDGTNRQFRQSGLHSNEIRLGGIPKFKIYGEALDPDLSNLRILTAALAVRPTPTSSVELVLHRYKLDQLGDEVVGTPITALINQAALSRDIGRAVDLVVAFRNLFGVRRLGLDVRTGWFRPGNAFLRDENQDPEGDPRLRRPQKSFAVVIKLWW